MTKFDLDGRLGHLRVAGAKLSADVAAAVTKATVDVSSTETTQLTVDLVESSDFAMLRSGLFNPGTPDRAGASVTLGRLEFEVRALEVGPLGGQHQVTVTARTAGVCKLKRSRGKLVRRNLSPTQFAALSARSAGLTFVGESSPSRPLITRSGGESEWDVLTRLGTELGYLCWEAGGVLYFGRPTWLVQRMPRFSVPWRGADTTPAVYALPNCRRSGDDPQAAATVEVSCHWDYGSGVLPGMALDLHGVPTFDGRYMVASVGLSLAEADPVTVSGQTPINPTPQPPQTEAEGGGKATSTNVSRPPKGRYAGTSFSAEQLGNALTIFQVGKAEGFSDRGVVVALATAMQESGLRNLKYGDRDSLGLFQQRAGWGSAATRLNPTKSARLFYQALRKVRGWEKLPITVAAQRVQISAFPNAYAKWEAEARAIVAAINSTARKSSTGTTKGGRAKSPVPSHPQVTYAFGVRNSRYAAGYHTGQDYGSAGVNGKAAVAVLSGTVRPGPGGAYGTSIMLTADNGHQYLYAHLSARVRASGRVKAGETIGRVGGTGNVTGPHLHLEESSGRTWSYGKVKEPSW